VPVGPGGGLFPSPRVRGAPMSLSPLRTLWPPRRGSRSAQPPSAPPPRSIKNWLALVSVSNISSTSGWSKSTTLTVVPSTSSTMSPVMRYAMSHSVLHRLDHRLGLPGLSWYLDVNHRYQSPAKASGCLCVRSTPLPPSLALSVVAIRHGLRPAPTRRHVRPWPSPGECQQGG
jgi:hypothetical protein